MVVAFFESIKYVGHLLPIALLRIFLGYHALNLALKDINSGYLTNPFIAEEIRSWLPRSVAADWYKSLLESYVIPHWQVFAYALIVAYLAIGVSYIVGYLVRPMSILGMILVYNLMLATSAGEHEFHSVLLLLIFFTMGWLGAGRCLGIDYFFYKRRRGLWW